MSDWIDFRSKSDYSDMVNGGKYQVEWAGSLSGTTMFFIHTVTWQSEFGCFHFDDGNAVDGVQKYRKLQNQTPSQTTKAPL